MTLLTLKVGHDSSWIQLDPAASSWIDLDSVGFSSIQLHPAGSSWIQLGIAGSRWIQLNPVGEGVAPFQNKIALTSLNHIVGFNSFVNPV